ncbi:MurNAc alpha-1-phosphate uridylyltransferase [Alteromonadaceae bacterium 2753L.S.0a.02]|nr:MurNAc alpha-1-phosphate uridylyltransferase [Alteromonadaceae bacterium 2753L.S.0a.02]
MIKRAMILAAGEGRRMRPLTDRTPKPLLQVAGRSLIEWQILKLCAAGIEDIVINVAHLGEQIMSALGDGRQFNVSLRYSVEPEPLETGGAINAALPLLGERAVLLVNGDIWTDFPLPKLLRFPLWRSAGHLVLVNNPEHHKSGDFELENEFIKVPGGAETFTFSGLSLLDPGVFAAYPQRRERFPLKEYFDWLITQHRLSGETYGGYWLDVGTPQRLAELSDRLNAYPPTQHL